MRVLVFITISVFIFLNSSAFSCNIDSLKSNILSQLYSQSDTILVFEEYGIGVEVYSNFDAKICESSNYKSIRFYWFENGLLFAKMIDNCGIYKTLPYDNYLIFNYYFDNEEEIRNEEFSQDIIREFENGKEVIAENVSIHYLYQKIDLIIHDRIIKTVESKSHYFDPTLNPENADINYNLLIRKWKTILAKDKNRLIWHSIEIKCEP